MQEYIPNSQERQSLKKGLESNVKQAKFLAVVGRIFGIVPFVTSIIGAITGSVTKADIIPGIIGSLVFFLIFGVLLYKALLNSKYCKMLQAYEDNNIRYYECVIQKIFASRDGTNNKTKTPLVLITKEDETDCTSQTLFGYDKDVINKTAIFCVIKGFEDNANQFSCVIKKI